MKNLFLITLMIILFFGCQSDSNIIGSEPQNTELTVINSTKDSVLMYLTLSGYNLPEKPKYVQNVRGILNCPQDGLQGFVWVKPNDTLSYISTKYFSGNISFVAVRSKYF
jgi:hypothetical protein